MAFPQPSLADDLASTFYPFLSTAKIDSIIFQLRLLEDKNLNLQTENLVLQHKISTLQDINFGMQVETDCLSYQNGRLGSLKDILISKVNPMRLIKKEIPQRSARAEALGTTEILESMILQAGPYGILQCEQVSKHWKAVIDGSVRLQRATFRAPVQEKGQQFAELNPFLFDNFNDGKQLIMTINVSNGSCRFELGHHIKNPAYPVIIRPDKFAIELRITVALKALHGNPTLDIPGYYLKPLNPNHSWSNMFLTQPPRTIYWHDTQSRQSYADGSSTIRLLGRAEPWLGHMGLPFQMGIPLPVTIGGILHPTWFVPLVEEEWHRLLRKADKARVEKLLRLLRGEL